MPNYTVRLPRLSVGWRDQPELFERYYNDAMSKLEETLNAILTIPELQDAITAAQDAADNANAAATVAQAAATSAQTVADSTQAESSLVNSYVANPVGTLISAASTGDVTIADHDRVYGDPVLNPTVSVDGDTLITGAASGSVIRVYYDQASRAGGAVTYLFSVDPAALPVQGGDRHVVGAVTIPMAGTGSGNGVRPPGYVEP